MKIYGWRTCYFNFKDVQVTIAITFLVTNVQEPILSFSHMYKQGIGCVMTTDKMELQFGEDGNIPIHLEGNHFYLHPSSFAEEPTDERIVICSTYTHQPLQISPSFAEYAPGMSMRKTTGGRTDYWETYKAQGVLRRVHRNPRRFAFKPTVETLPRGFKDLSNFKPTRRSVIKTTDGHTYETNDTWTHNEYRKPIDPEPATLWTGFLRSCTFTHHMNNDYDNVNLQLQIPTKWNLHQSG